ncbi:MAG: hypothetical protein ACI4QB_04925, partial [Eubacteriales bacterium]
ARFRYSYTAYSFFSFVRGAFYTDFIITHNRYPVKPDSEFIGSLSSGGVRFPARFALAFGPQSLYNNSVIPHAGSLSQQSAKRGVLCHVL